MKITLINDQNPLIRKKSVAVTLPLNHKTRKLLTTMIEYLKKTQDEEYAAKHHLREGVGLAAPQIGVLLRMFVVYFQKEAEICQYALVNPRIIAHSVKLCYLQNGEGCLSVGDEHPGYVYRYHKVTIRAFDLLQDREIEVTAKGFAAIVLQHELDHLDGILFYDHINKDNPFLKREDAIEI